MCHNVPQLRQRDVVAHDLQGSCRDVVNHVRVCVVLAFAQRVHDTARNARDAQLRGGAGQRTRRAVAASTGTQLAHQARYKLHCSGRGAHARVTLRREQQRRHAVRHPARVQHRVALHVATHAAQEARTCSAAHPHGVTRKTARRQRAVVATHHTLTSEGPADRRTRPASLSQARRP
jgi:hypothetical protein